MECILLSVTGYSDLFCSPGAFRVTGVVPGANFVLLISSFYCDHTGRWVSRSFKRPYGHRKTS